MPWRRRRSILSGGDPAALPSVRDGRAGVQDEGSQLVTLALTQAPLDGPDDRWLDLCAGPGGKAALLAAVAGERGARIVANEVQPHRTRLVEQALRAVPADAVEDVRTGDGRTVGTDEPGAYDRVMVDAPVHRARRAAPTSRGALAPHAGRPREPQRAAARPAGLGAAGRPARAASWRT